MSLTSQRERANRGESSLVREGGLTVPTSRKTMSVCYSSLWRKNTLIAPARSRCSIRHPGGSLRSGGAMFLEIKTATANL